VESIRAIIFIAIKNILDKVYFITLHDWPNVPVSLAGTDCDLSTNVPELVQEPMMSQQPKRFVKVAGIVYYFETAVVRQGTLNQFLTVISNSRCCRSVV